MGPSSDQPAAALHLHSLYQVLTWAISPNQQQLQLATNQLQEWQKEPQYHALLQRIVGDFSLAFDVRWLAAIQLKNGIDKYWRKTAIYAISKEEKATIRARCVPIGVNEPDQRLALQNAVFVSKIVRVDYPHDWPDAIGSILEAIHESSAPDVLSKTLPRALLLLLTTVKELSTAKLIRTRRTMYSVAPDILSTVARVYVGSWNLWHATLEAGTDEAETVDKLETSLLCLRLLRRLVTSCFENPARDPHVHAFWSTITEHFQSVISILRQHGHVLPQNIKSLLERHILQMAKLHLGMIDSHPSAFPQLPNAIDIARAYWEILKDFGSTFGAQGVQASSTAIGTDGDAEDAIPFMEKVSLRGLMLLRGCVKMVYNPAPTLKYQTPEDKQERIESKESMKQGLLSEDLVKEMMEMLVVKFFVFRPIDLRRWQEEPDEWERKEEGEGDSWKYSVRICAEKLFLDLVLNHKDLLIEPLLNFFWSVGADPNTSVLVKDSIYGAIGLAAPALAGKVDLNTFIQSTMLPELRSQQEGYSVLRRRAAIFLGQWVPVDSGNLNTNSVYEIFQYLLDKTQPLNDLVVRVTAGRQVKNAIDIYSDPGAKLDPFLAPILESILELVDEVDLPETKMALLSTVQTLIQTMGEGITRHADQIINRLPPIWDAADKEFILKQNIMGLISELFRAMKTSSVKYHPLVLPLIGSALDLENEDRLNLVEDAVDLWSAVLTESPESSDPIINLLPHLYPLFDNDDTMNKALEISNSYLLLAPQVMLGEPTTRLFQTFKILLDQPLKRSARVAICDVIEQLLVVALSVGGKDAMVQVAAAADHTGLASCIIGGLMDAHKAHQDPSARPSSTDVDGKVETKYWCVLSRFVLGSPEVLAVLIQSWIRSTGSGNEDSTTGILLQELFSHYESLGDTTSSKTVILATTALFGYAEPNVRTPSAEFGVSLQGFLELCTSAVLEWAADGKDSLIWGEDAREPPETFEPTAESRRRHNLDFTDPVRRVDTREAIKAAIYSYRGDADREAFFDAYFRTVDKYVREQFLALGLIG